MPKSLQRITVVNEIQFRMSGTIDIGASMNRRTLRLGLEGVKLARTELHSIERRRPSKKF